MLVITKAFRKIMGVKLKSIKTGVKVINDYIDSSN